MRCNFRESDKPRCAELALYRVEFTDCEPCQSRGYLFCLGHRACLTHAANSRADRYCFTANRADVVPKRMSSIR